MRLTENIEKFIRIRKPYIATDSDTDRRILHDSFVAMDEATHARSADAKPNTWKVIVQSRMTKVAAALIAVAIGFLVVHRALREPTHSRPVSEAGKSPGEMMTAMSLNIAYRKGGLEAVEKQGDRAFKMLRLQPTSISVRQLLEEFDSEEVERKEL